MFEDEYRSMTVSEGPEGTCVPTKLALINRERKRKIESDHAKRLIGR